MFVFVLVFVFLVLSLFLFLVFLFLTMKTNRLSHFGYVSNCPWLDRAAKVGLVIITLERYFKVVHAIGHRKHYRDWMNQLGVAAPWISGISTFIIPASLSTRAVPDQCPMMGFWPSKGGQMVCQIFDEFNVHQTRNWFTFCDPATQ